MNVSTYIVRDIIVYMHIQCPRMYHIHIRFMYMLHVSFFFFKNKAWRLHCICVCLYVCVSRCLSLYVFIYGEREFFFPSSRFFFPLPSPISHIYIRYPILPTLFILERKLYTLKSPSLHAAR